MPLDPQVVEPLRLIRERRPFKELGVAGSREWLRTRPAAPTPALALALAVEDRTAESAVPVRVYLPVGDRPLPAIVFAHGGGWIMGDLDSADGLCRRLAGASGCAVVSVGYRLAPEHRFPAALEDVLAVVRWLLAEGAAAGLDGTRLSLAGESVGASLAASGCLALRGLPEIRCQLLLCPALDPELATPSWRELGSDYLPTADDMAWMWSLYADADAYVSPLAAERLDGLPPALILTAEYDPLRDEGEAYGARLRAAGVPVEVHRTDGVLHSSFLMAHAVDRARVALEDAGGKLAARLA